MNIQNLVVSGAIVAFLLPLHANGQTVSTVPGQNYVAVVGPQGGFCGATACLSPDIGIPINYFATTSSVTNLGSQTAALTSQVNGVQSNVTTLNTQVSGIQSNVSALSSQFANFNTQVNGFIASQQAINASTSEALNRLGRGVAMASSFALEGPLDGKANRLSIGVGAYGDSNAVSVNYAHRSGQYDMGAAVSFAGGSTLAKADVGFSW